MPLFKYSKDVLHILKYFILVNMNSCGVTCYFLVGTGHPLNQPAVGAPWCQCNQPGSVILWLLCTQTHTHTHQGTAELMTHLSVPPPSLSLSLNLSLSVSVWISVSVHTGDITQKGYEKKRSKLLAPYIPQIQGKTHTGL